MNLLLPWIRIFLAVFAYIVIALLASAIVRKIGQSLKEMEGRTSPKVLFVGAITNLFVLGTTLLLLVFLDKRTISSLGIHFSNRDLAFAAIGAVTIFILAAAFVGLLKQSGRFQVNPNKPLKNFSEAVKLFRWRYRVTHCGSSGRSSISWIHHTEFVVLWAGNGDRRVNNYLHRHPSTHKSQ